MMTSRGPWSKFTRPTVQPAYPDDLHAVVEYVEESTDKITRFLEGEMRFINLNWLPAESFSG